MTGPLQIPEWMATLVGRLVLENEAMRQQLMAQAEPLPTNGVVPEPEMAE